MAKETESRGSGSAGGQQPGKETGNPGTQGHQPIGGGAISREADASGKAGGEGSVSQQANAAADSDGPSRQTSTAQDESGQL